MPKEEFPKLERKEGIKYIRCQHLKEGTQLRESGAWWIGDNLRVIACPVCARTHAGNMLNYIRGLAVEVNTYYAEEKKREKAKNGWLSTLRAWYEKAYSVPKE